MCVDRVDMEGSMENRSFSMFNEYEASCGSKGNLIILASSVLEARQVATEHCSPNILCDIHEKRRKSRIKGKNIFLIESNMASLSTIFTPSSRRKRNGVPILLGVEYVILFCLYFIITFSIMPIILLIEVILMLIKNKREV